MKQQESIGAYAIKASLRLRGLALLDETDSLLIDESFFFNLRTRPSAQLVCIKVSLCLWLSLLCWPVEGRHNLHKADNPFVKFNQRFWHLPAASVRHFCLESFGPRGC